PRQPSHPTGELAAMCLIIQSFHDHAGEDELLDKTELKRLLKTEMPGLLFSLDDQGSADKMSFPEYMTLMASFACACQGQVKSMM
uniref:S100/CaBP-9k-type calcium binding subdomain domain-containing protein n=1 Tax=Neogobius melanostomus TaxID=47308 RepID=A0A8C6S379_9GOBI